MRLLGAAVPGFLRGRRKSIALSLDLGETLHINFIKKKKILPLYEKNTESVFQDTASVTRDSDPGNREQMDRLKQLITVFKDFPGGGAG